MIRFRPIARSFYLTVVGTFVKKISPGVHILNGHVLSFSSDPKKGAFEELLAQLSKECRFIRIEDAVSLIKNGVEVDEPLVAFTFDDGYSECYTKIAPALERYDVNAAFFINPNLVDCTLDYKKDFFATRVPDIPVRDAMNRQMIIDLAERGFVIGGHTLDHVRLVGLSAESINEQVVDCKYAIEEMTGRACDYFAWTYGKFSDIDVESLSIALQAYQYVFSSDNYSDYSTIPGVLNRRHFECDWPISHLRYFLSVKRF